MAQIMSSGPAGADATLDVPVFALEIRAGCSDGRAS